MLSDCPKTIVELRVNGDLATAFQTRDEDLDRCNVDKAALRYWYTELEQKVNKGLISH